METPEEEKKRINEEFLRLSREFLERVQKEMIEQLPIIERKLRVIRNAQIINNCCLIIFVTNMVLPRNNINVWFTPIAFLVMIGSFIYTRLFLKYYGRKKHQSGGSQKDPDPNETGL